MSDSTFDVIVIGAGVAGLTAARESARRGLASACAEELMFGGLVVNINELDPVPPEHSHSGADLGAELMMQVSDLGVVNISAPVTAVERNAGLFTVLASDEQYRARAVIVASGARLRRLGVPGEAEFEYRGVSQCADCDGPLYKGKDVVVVGGGDSALQEALVLANFCNRVLLVHRGDRYTARPQFVEAARGRKNIEHIARSVVVEVRGSDGVNGVLVRKLGDGATSEIPCAGFFAYVGLEPNSNYLPSAIQRDAGGFVMTDAALQTTMPGVFAAGAVRAGFGGLLTDAISDAQLAVAGVAAYAKTH